MTINKGKKEYELSEQFTMPVPDDWTDIPCPNCGHEYDFSDTDNPFLPYCLIDENDNLYCTNCQWMEGE